MAWDLLHLDTKKLGRIAGVGHRITDRASNVNLHHGIGWEYLQITVDDHSRVAYELLADERGVTAAGFLRCALRWFRNDTPCGAVAPQRRFEMSS